MCKLIISIFFMSVFVAKAIGISLAGGSFFSLVLKEDGTVWAWGDNGYGQLGDGTDTLRLTPVQVSGLTDVISISAGSDHSLALKRDGTVWAWGDNWYGQVGDGTKDNIRFTPVQVVGLSGVVAVAAGSSYSMALRDDGTVWVWGLGVSSQIGNSDEFFSVPIATTPVQVTGISNGIAIERDGDHSLVLKNDGTVWAWGDNRFGQLGDGTTDHRLAPVQVTGFSNGSAVVAGMYHSLALKEDGTVWAWGNNTYGQLGNGNGGTYTNSLTAVQSLISGVLDIRAATAYSLALTSYGTVWFWGEMGFFNTVESSINPVPVNDISGVKAIAAAPYHILVLRNDGTLWWWGAYIGEKGVEYQLDPVQVKGFSTGGSATVPSTVLAADFDEDGKADPTAVNSAGQLFFWNSSQSFSREGPISLGVSDLSPIALASGDVNADGQPDLALVDSSGNPSTSSGQAWYFFLSDQNGDYSYAGSQTFGQTGTPLLADFDGDEKADPTIVSSAGLWTIWLSGAGYSPTSGQFLPSTAYSLQPVAADFDADGRADPVMVDANGNWYFWLSSYFYQLYGNRSYYFGLTGKPVAGDFDGDGKADPAMMDSSGNWYFWLSGSFYTRDGPYYLVLP